MMQTPSDSHDTRVKHTSQWTVGYHGTDADHHRTAAHSPSVKIRWSQGLVFQYKIFSYSKCKELCYWDQISQSHASSKRPRHSKLHAYRPLHGLGSMARLHVKPLWPPHESSGVTIAGKISYRSSAIAAPPDRLQVFWRNRRFCMIVAIMPMLCEMGARPIPNRLAMAF